MSQAEPLMTLSAPSAFGGFRTDLLVGRLQAREVKVTCPKAHRARSRTRFASRSGTLLSHTQSTQRDCSAVGKIHPYWWEGVRTEVGDS